MAGRRSEGLALFGTSASSARVREYRTERTERNVSAVRSRWLKEAECSRRADRQGVVGQVRWPDRLACPACGSDNARAGANPQAGGASLP